MQEGREVKDDFLESGLDDKIQTLIDECWGKIEQPWHQMIYAGVTDKNEIAKIQRVLQAYEKMQSKGKNVSQITKEDAPGYMKDIFGEAPTKAERLALYRILHPDKVGERLESKPSNIREDAKNHAEEVFKFYNGCLRWLAKTGQEK